MRAETRRAGRLLTAALTAATLAGGADGAQAASFQVIYSFTGGADGGLPLTPKLAADPFGAVYGSTYAGGAGGKGTVWKLQPSTTVRGGWKLSVLHAFGSESERPREVQRDGTGRLFVGADGPVGGPTQKISAIAPGTHVLSPVTSVPASDTFDFTIAGLGRIVGISGFQIFQVTQSHGTWATQNLHSFSTSTRRASTRPGWRPDRTVRSTGPRRPPCSGSSRTRARDLAPRGQRAGRGHPGRAGRSLFRPRPVERRQGDNLQVAAGQTRRDGLRLPVL